MGGRAWGLYCVAEGLWGASGNEILRWTDSSARRTVAYGQFWVEKEAQ